MVVSFRRLLLFFHFQSQRGLSMIELLVTIGIVALMGALAMPRLNSSVLNLSTATQNLIADLRLTRANAVSRGAHYRVTFSGSSYTIQRLQDDDGDGAWEPTGSPQTVNFPAGITLSVTDGDGLVEFDTRGLVTPPPDGSPVEIETLTIHDQQRGGTQQVDVWPSGQVQEV